MIANKWKCTNNECTLCNLLEDYEYLGFGTPRPVCRECGQAPNLEAIPATYKINTRGCSGGSSHYTH